MKTGPGVTMVIWMRRIRGAIGMAFTWAVAWSFVGTFPRWVFGFNADAPFPLIFGILGFIAGLLFSAILLLTERRRTFDQMSLPRFASWGGIGGILLAGVFTRMASLSAHDAFLITPSFAAICAVCASGSLALARQGEKRELADGSGDAAAKLTSSEKHKLL